MAALSSMKLPGLAIPEFEKLPAEARTSFLLRCDESEEMRRCRSQTQLMAKLGLLCLSTSNEGFGPAHVQIACSSFTGFLPQVTEL
jgi:hypothetical protein